MKKNNKIKIIYEPEDDVLNIWFSKKQIDYAEDNNYVITHYTKEDEPVYVEVLFASRFLKKKDNLKKAKNTSKEAIQEDSLIAISHRIK